MRLQTNCGTQRSEPASETICSKKVNFENQKRNSSDSENQFSKRLTKNIVATHHENLYGFVNALNSIM